MKFLVITQKVNKNDSNLGFFCSWLQKLSSKTDYLYVACLNEEEHSLDTTKVTVKSVSKGPARESKNLWQTIKKFIALRKIIKSFGSEYDAVFIHMVPEYTLLRPIFWRRKHKKILLWYTHKSVTIWLRLANLIVNKIFTASKESYRLANKKVEVSGHGIEIERFARPVGPVRNSNELRLLAVGRTSPVKDLETVIQGLNELCKRLLNKNINPDNLINLTIIGKPLTEESNAYQNRLNQLVRQSGLSWHINFTGGFPHSEMPLQYQRHDILIHTSQTGSMDKVVLEALAAGLIVVTSSEAYADLADGELKNVLFKFPLGDYQELAKTIEKIYKNDILNTIPNQRGIDYVRKQHNLDNLVSKIIGYFKSV